MVHFLSPGSRGSEATKNCAAQYIAVNGQDSKKMGKIVHNTWEGANYGTGKGRILDIR